MNHLSHQPAARPRSTGFEALVAAFLFGLGLLALGAALDVIYRLVLAGWRATDFLFNLFFTNP